MIELFLARKIHFNKKDKNSAAAMPPAIRLALLGIALGLAVMILTLAIMVGFKKEVRNKVIGFGSHIQITALSSNSTYELEPIVASDSLLSHIASFEGVRHVEPFATKTGMLKTDEDFQGVVMKGVDASYDWAFFAQHLKEGQLPKVDSTKTSNDIIVSRSLMNKLRLKLNDRVLFYSVQEDVRVRRFTICGVYETGFSNYDDLFIIGDVRHVRRLNAWSDKMASGIEIFVDDFDRLDTTAETLFFDFAERKDSNGTDLFVRSIKEINPMIFSWLAVQDLNVIIILALVLAVAGFTMISGLLIIILERINMIGILKALGMDNWRIQKVFLTLAFFLIGRGMLWGNIVGVTLCIIQKHFQIISLNPAAYYLDSVPIELSLTSWLWLNVGTMAASLTMMIAPTFLVTKIEPAKSIRFE